MKIYTVERMDKFDYDFSVELKKCGCFYNKKNALQKAKEVYKFMCGEYKNDMARYADEEDDASGKTHEELQKMAKQYDDYDCWEAYPVETIYHISYEMSVNIDFTVMGLANEALKNNERQ